MAFRFPQQLVIAGNVYHLLYDPSQGGVMPELNSPKVDSCGGKWVQIPTPNGTENLWMTMVNLVYPAQRTATGIRPAQLVKAFKITQKQEVPEQVPPNEMVMYIRSLPIDDDFQEVVNAVVGTVIQTKTPQDKNWADRIFGNERVGNKSGESDREDTIHQQQL